MGISIGLVRRGSVLIDDSVCVVWISSVDTGRIVWSTLRLVLLLCCSCCCFFALDGPPQSRCRRYNRRLDGMYGGRPGKAAA